MMNVASSPRVVDVVIAGQQAYASAPIVVFNRSTKNVCVQMQLQTDTIMLVPWLPPNRTCLLKTVPMFGPVVFLANALKIDGTVAEVVDSVTPLTLWKAPLVFWKQYHTTFPLWMIVQVDTPK